MLRLPKDNFVLLETNRFDKDNYRSYLFSNPVKIIYCYNSEEVKQAIADLEGFVLRGYYAAGFISYEAGFSFENNLKNLWRETGFPLLWFGVYKNPQVVTHKRRLKLIRHRRRSYLIRNLRPNISRNTYINDIKKIKDYIRRGYTYQVNYTFKYRFNFQGSTQTFYEDLKEKQSVSYSSFIKTPEFSILSLSPELFFRKTKDNIQVRPMKGTIERGMDIEQDRRNMDFLRNSLKDRSENVMIVDLLRNDLGRISRPGTVMTKKLFEVEKYETLFQMISIVESKLRRDIMLYDLLKAIFPSGSVTGAPKISTMKIIKALEKEPRLVYTGGVGFFAPGGNAVFNVAIRTVLINNKANRGEMGIGSGIVYDSDPGREYNECRLKADFMMKRERKFRLIETLLWRHRRGYFLLKYHLDRLTASSEYFNFEYDKKKIVEKLRDLSKKFSEDADYRVRLLLDRYGKTELGFSKIDGCHGSLKIRFSDKKVFSGNIFLYHKTTNRGIYDREYKKWRKKGYFDIIFTNEKGEVTEGAISNIIIKKRRFYYTPPISCGLLNGVFRRYLLKEGKIPLKEKVLERDDIITADEIYMINSVRGMRKVIL